MQRERGEQSPGAPEAEVKAVIVGDGGCGKTSLLVAFAKGDFPKVPGCLSPGGWVTLSLCGSGDGQRAVGRTGWRQRGRLKWDMGTWGWPSLGLMGACDTSASLGGSRGGAGFVPP